MNNVGGTDVRYQLDPGNWTDRLSGEVCSGSVTLQTWAMLWLELAM